MRKSVEKASAHNVKRIRRRTEETTEADTAAARALQDARDRATQRVATCTAQYQQLVSRFEESCDTRRAVGAERWNTLRLRVEPMVEALVARAGCPLSLAPQPEPMSVPPSPAVSSPASSDKPRLSVASLPVSETRS